MPAPKDHTFSSDAILYNKLYEPLAKQLCWTEPDYITILCFLMLFPILYALEMKWSLPVLLALMFVRQSLDCLDGGVARACNKKSKTGALLDLLEDTLTISLLGGYVTYKMYKNRRMPMAATGVIGAGTLVLLYVFSQHLLRACRDEPSSFTGVEQVLHDNTVILSLISIVVARYIISYR